MSMIPDRPSLDLQRDEYKLVFEGCKFFVSTRFIAIAFAMSIQSALVPIFNQVVKENIIQGYSIFGLAMLFLLATFIIERRTTSIYRGFIGRGNELEFQLGLLGSFFHRIAELSENKGLRSFVRYRWGFRLFYAGMTILWIMLLFTAVTKETKPEPKEKNNDTAIAFIQHTR